MFWRKKEKWAKEDDYEVTFDTQAPLERESFPGVTTGKHPVETGLAFSLMMPFGESKTPPVDALPPVVGPNGTPEEARLYENLAGLLENAWGITQHDELVRTIEALLDPPMDEDYLYRLFRPFLQKFVNMAPGEREAAAQPIIDETMDNLQINPEFVVMARSQLQQWLDLYLQPGSTKVLPQRLPRTLVGWDTARAARITRIGYAIGLLSEEEATTYSHRALAVTRENSTSWREHTDSFLLGRAKWQEKLDNETLEHRDMMWYRLNHPESPWAKHPLHG